jgi:CheY-like chemotaxis protein
MNTDITQMRHTILLVEDDELDIISVRRSLAKLGGPYDLQIAFNGKEAYTYLESHPEDLPDVILLDLNMPRMNGIEFLTRLRQEDKYKDIKVFIMTTSNEKADRQVTEQLGISGYIIKPLSYNANTKRLDAMDSFVEFHLRKILDL